MKTLLITLFLLLFVVSGNNQGTVDENLLIARTEIYITPDDVLTLQHWVRRPYFRYDYEVEYKLFERFVLQYEEDDIIKWVRRIKERQMLDTLIRKI